MSTRKWGETFLKSGLPLEHLAAVTLKSLNWHVEANDEYQRVVGPSEPWFELDLFASSPRNNGDTELGLLIETKYHDTSRFWMFLPADDNSGWRGDNATLNLGPLDTLKKPIGTRMVRLAPLSSMGVVLSEDGQKQENAIHTAMEQLINAFVPYGAIERLFDFNFMVREDADNMFWVTALVPMIVTNASLFRLRPNVRDLDKIRNASAPTDVADAIDWTWCRARLSAATTVANRKSIEAYDKPHVHMDPEDPFFGDALHSCLQDFAHRPHWIAVVHIDALGRVAQALEDAFIKVKTHPIDALDLSKKALRHMLARKKR